MTGASGHVAEVGVINRVREDLACPAEVRLTEGTVLRARVIHAATCPWHQRLRAPGPRQGPRGESPTQIAKALGVSRASVYRHLGGDAQEA